MAEYYHQPLFLLYKMETEDVLRFFFHVTDRARQSGAAQPRAQDLSCDQVDWL